MKRWLPLLLLCLLLLTGCRSRVTSDRNGEDGDSAGIGRISLAQDDREGKPLTEDTAPADTMTDDADRKIQNPGAERIQYDESASAKVQSTASKSLHQQGDDVSGFAPGNEAGLPVDGLSPDAERKAEQTLRDENAQRMGTDDQAGEADSFYTYYSALLQDRLGDLFECQRLDLYWEELPQLTTIHRSSDRHRLIIASGCYDVSSKLLPQNLRVDTDWVRRKNPGVIVKVVPSATLGHGVTDTYLASAEATRIVSREGWNTVSAVRGGRVILLSQELLDTPELQLAVRLIIAKAAAPDLFDDVDPALAIQQLTQQKHGVAAEGIYYYIHTQ